MSELKVLGKPIMCNRLKVPLFLVNSLDTGPRSLDLSNTKPIMWNRLKVLVNSLGTDSGYSGYRTVWILWIQDHSGYSGYRA